MGYFRVPEFTSRHTCHVHMAVYLDGHPNQATYPVAEKAGGVWQEITKGEGDHNRCDRKKCYEADITRPVNYDDAEAISGLCYIISYLAREKSKHGQTYYGAREWTGQTTKKPLRPGPEGNTAINLLPIDNIRSDGITTRSVLLRIICTSQPEPWTAPVPGSIVLMRTAHWLHLSLSGRWYSPDRTPG